MRATILAILLTLSWLALPSRVPAETYSEAIERGDRMLEDQDYRGAIKAYKKAHKQAKEPSFECCYGLARAYNRVGSYKDGAKSAREAVAAAKSAEERLMAQNTLGLVLLAGGRASSAQLEEAVTVFRQILEVSPINNVRFNLGFALLKLERDDEGVAVLKEFLEGRASDRGAELAKSYIANPRRARANMIPDLDLLTLSGERITTADLAGKVILIDFWATWCAPCIQSLPHLRKLHKMTETSPFMLVSISSDVDRDKLRSFVSENFMPWPQVWDGSRTLGKREFKIEGYPSFVLVSHEGEILYQESGWG
ncbi:MAG: redoxin family protein, partial [Acidobacteriota bacterium]